MPTPPLALLTGVTGRDFGGAIKGLLKSYVAVAAFALEELRFRGDEDIDTLLRADISEGVKGVLTSERER